MKGIFCYVESNYTHCNSILAIIIGCVIYLNIDFTLNKGEEDVTYNGIV